MKTIVLFLLFQLSCIGMASWAWGWLFDDPIATGTREWSTVVTLGSFVLMAVAFFVFGDRFMAEVVKRKWIVPALFLALCFPASAAPLPPFPTTVKRPAPLLSPKAASAPKSTPMARFTVASVNPPVPMKVYYRRANSQFGTHELTAEAKQPANSAILFEVSPTLGAWVALAWYGPYPVEQQVFAALYSYEERLFIRATQQPPTQAPMELRITEASVLGARSGIQVNPRFKGARAWTAPTAPKKK